MRMKKMDRGIDPHGDAHGAYERGKRACNVECSMVLWCYGAVKIFIWIILQYRDSESTYMPRFARNRGSGVHVRYIKR